MKNNPARGGKRYQRQKDAGILEDDLSLLPVLISPGRDRRPSDRKKSKSPPCPFCPGAEDSTPPTVLAVPEEKNWQIRVFDNLFPLVSADKKTETYGIHEVIVETPRHDAVFHKLSVRQISLVMRTLRDRMKHHGDDENLKCLIAFRNQGFRGGASLVHPHSQLVGMSWIPPRIASESQGFLRLSENGRCPLCLDSKDPLIIIEEETFRAFSPRTPRFPHETWIAPVHHEPGFENLKNTEIDDLAALFKKTMNALAKLTTKAKKDFEYNLVLHTEPLDDDSGTFHTHIEILPRPESLAGFEIGSGLLVNPVPPDQSVSELREVLFT